MDVWMDGLLGKNWTNGVTSGRMDSWGMTRIPAFYGLIKIEYLFHPKSLEIQSNVMGFVD